MKDYLQQIFLGYQVDDELERIYLNTVWSAEEHLEDRGRLDEDPYSATYTIVVF